MVSARKGESLQERLVISVPSASGVELVQRGIQAASGDFEVSREHLFAFGDSALVVHGKGSVVAALAEAALRKQESGTVVLPPKKRR